jgi:hypothetical protein
MYHYVKKLVFTVRVDEPDPRFGNMLSRTVRRRERRTRRRNAYLGNLSVENAILVPARPRDGAFMTMSRNRQRTMQFTLRVLTRNGAVRWFTRSPGNPTIVGFPESAGLL